MVLRFPEHHLEHHLSVTAGLERGVVPKFRGEASVTPLAPPREEQAPVKGYAPSEHQPKPWPTRPHQEIGALSFRDIHNNDFDSPLANASLHAEPLVTAGSPLRRLRGPRRLDALLPSSFQSPPRIGQRRRFQTEGRRRPWNTAVTTTTSARMR